MENVTVNPTPEQLKQHAEEMQNRTVDLCMAIASLTKARNEPGPIYLAAIVTLYHEAKHSAPKELFETLDNSVTQGVGQLRETHEKGKIIV